MGEPELRERRAIARLLRFYRPGAGRWIRPTGAAWQLALAIESVVTAYSRTRDPAYERALRAWLHRHHARRSRFYDDNGWYVNAWLRAYEATGDDSFLAAAHAGFTDLTGGWDGACGGGLWWSRDRTYKNAITTGLFLLAAARLAHLGGAPRPDVRSHDAPGRSTPPLDAASHLRWALRAERSSEVAVTAGNVSALASCLEEPQYEGNPVVHGKIGK